VVSETPVLLRIKNFQHCRTRVSMEVGSSDLVDLICESRVSVYSIAGRWSRLGKVSRKVQSSPNIRMQKEGSFETPSNELTQQDYRVRYPNFLQRINYEARHSGNIGPSMAPNFCFISHTSQTDPMELSS